MFRKLLAVMTAFALTAVPVSAAELPPDVSVSTEPEMPGNSMSDKDEAPFGGDMSSLIGNMTESSLKNGNASLSNALSENFGIALESSPYFSTGSFHDPGLSLDTGNMNSQYEALAASLLQSSENSFSSLGNSGNALSLFNEEYGDIAKNLTLDHFEIPDNFNPQSMVSTMHDSMLSQYSDAVSSGSFAAIKGSIDIGDIFSKANQGLSSDIVNGLMDSGSMRTMLSGLSSGIASDMKSEFEAKKSANAPDMSNFYSNAMSNTMNAFDWSDSMVMGSSAGANFNAAIAEKKSIGQAIAAEQNAINVNTWEGLKSVKADELADIRANNGSIVEKAIHAAEDYLTRDSNLTFESKADQDEWLNKQAVNNRRYRELLEGKSNAESLMSGNSGQAKSETAKSEHTNGRRREVEEAKKKADSLG